LSKKIESFTKKTVSGKENENLLHFYTRLGNHSNYFRLMERSDGFYHFAAFLGMDGGEE